jgi:hypothetical protein
VVLHETPENREQRKNEEYRRRGNVHHMARADFDAHVWRDHLKSGALLQSLLHSAQVVALLPPKPLFVAGQSCIQWWAPWFQDAKAPPLQYNKKKRLAWFSGEVMSREGYGSIRYAGILQAEMHLYRTY